MYVQVDGISMGSPLGPILANIFLGFMKNHSSTGSLTLKFIYDTWMTLLLVLVHIMEVCLSSNDIHLSLTFTMDEEKDHKLLFVYILVERRSFAFVTCIYRKPTLTSLHFIWYAFAPKLRKVNLIKCHTLRAPKTFCDNKIKSKFEQIFKKYFGEMSILRKSLLKPLTNMLISLGITSKRSDFQNAQFMLDNFGLDLLASWLLIRFLLLFYISILDQAADQRCTCVNKQKVIMWCNWK